VFVVVVCIIVALVGGCTIASGGATLDGPSSISSSLSVVAVIVVVAAELGLEMQQEEHKHKSFGSCFGLTGLNQERYAEKKRSPLSVGRTSASGMVSL